MRTVIYARYSSQLQNSRSIDDQISACRDRADREGWPIVDAFTDYAIGGGAGIEGQRPGLTAMLARIEAGGIEQVLADTSSRIARNQGDAHHIRDQINYGGARLFTLADGEIDAFKGAFKGLLDEQQRKELRHNIKRGQRGMVEKGRAPAGIAYGYRRANRLDERGDLVRGLRDIDEEQAAIVRRIFAEYADGVSPQAIAVRLNQESVPGPRGGQWTESTIRGERKRMNGMLVNRLYNGELIVNRTSKVIDPRTRNTRIRPNPESEWIVSEAPAMRIIEPVTWRRVQDRIIETRGKPIHAQRRDKHMLSGLGRCASCDGTYIRIATDYWGCGNYRDGRRCTNGRKIKSDRYEAEVIAHLTSQLLDPELVAIWVREYHREAARRAGDVTKERAKLERRLEESGRKVTRLVDAIAKGVTVEEVMDALAKARAERDTAADELTRLEALPLMTLHPGIAEGYRRQIEDLGEALNDPAAKPEAVPKFRALIDRITLHPRPEGRGVDVAVTTRLDAMLRLAASPAIVKGPRHAHG